MNLRLMESTARLAAQKKNIERRREATMRAAMEALVGYNRARAQMFWEESAELTDLHETAQGLSDSLSEGKGNIYVASRSFLSELNRAVTTGENEEIVHITGPHFGNVRVLSEIHKLPAAKQSRVYVEANHQECADAEIAIISSGQLLLTVAHSHPGRGPNATHPSSIDLNYLERIQRLGSEAIGLITVRDQWFRFFSVLREFQVLVIGAGVNHTEEHVFQIAIP